MCAGDWMIWPQRKREYIAENCSCTSKNSDWNSLRAIGPVIFSVLCREEFRSSTNSDMETTVNRVQLPPKLPGKYFARSFVYVYLYWTQIVISGRLQDVVPAEGRLSQSSHSRVICVICEIYSTYPPFLLNKAVHILAINICSSSAASTRCFPSICCYEHIRYHPLCSRNLSHTKCGRASYVCQAKYKIKVS